MSKCVLRRRGKLMSQAAFVSIVTVFAASCSSDFSRLDDPFVTASLPTPNQRSIIRKQDIPDQPYPGRVDPITTAPAGRTLASSAQRRVKTSQPYPKKPGVKQYLAKTFGPPAVKKPAKMMQDSAEGPYENVASLTTGSISPVKSRPRSLNIANGSKINNYKAGWTAIGGTRVQLRQGENLHNLSRRYGVPVSEIKRANNISDARNVTPGQSILIPTYTYSRNAAVSAPDSNATTRASRSSRGFDGEVANTKVTVPKRRAARRTIRQKSGSTAKLSGKTAALPTRRATLTGIHTVVSGDTLGGIAQKYGVSKNAVKQANGMDGDGVRLGKKLTIPTANSSRRIAGNRTGNKNSRVDPIVTGSTGPAAKGRKSRSGNSRVAIARRSTEKGPTPKQTGISTFRWPAKGRVVSKFGSKKNGAPNDGIDISVPVGTPVKAAENGTVIYAGSELEEFGKLILVRHAGGWVSAYAHSSRNLVARGNTVRRGEMIARSGRSGIAGVPKVHFELRKNSSPVNPLNHLKRS